MNVSTSSSCIICGHNKFRRIGKPKLSDKVKPFIDKGYLVVQCEYCLLYSVSPSINFSVETWGELYGDEYFFELTSWWAKKRDKDRKQRFNRLVRSTPRTIKTFLDVGSGEGYFLLEALGRGWETHGVDISDNRIDEARDGNISFFKGNIFDANYPDNYFDCIYMDSVLEHVPDPLAYLNKINRIMKDQGVLYIGVPNENALFNVAKRVVNAFSGQSDYSSRIKPFISPYHIHGFTKKTLQVIAQRSNFESLGIKNFGGHYDFLKHRVLTKSFFIQIALLPMHLLALPLRKQTYLDVIFRKISS